MKLKVIGMCLATVLALTVSTIYIFNIPSPAANKISTERKIDPTPLVIDIPTPCDYGFLEVLDQDGNTMYGYYGSISIINDGRDGHVMQIEVISDYPCSCFDEE